MTDKCSCTLLATLAGGVLAATAAAGNPTTNVAEKPYLGPAGASDAANTSAQFVAIEKELNPAVPTFGLGGEPNETCADAIALACNSSVTYDNSGNAPGWDTPLGTCFVGSDQTNSVWYSFVATDTAATISLCNSVQTDSTVQLFSGACGNLVEIGCGEDECGDSGFLSTFGVQGLVIGDTYFIQTGSWSAAEVGSYTLELTCESFVGCVECPADGIDEGEVDCFDEYEDFYNSGCNATPPPPQFNGPMLAPGDTVCGTYGTYEFTNPDGTVVNFRDTDWYTFVAPNDGFLNVTWQGEAGTAGFIIDAGPGFDCSVLAILATATGAPCEEVSASLTVAAGDELVIFAGTSVFTGVPCGTPYTVNVTLGAAPTGACCSLDGNICTEVTELQCDGFYQGNGTLCADTECCQIVCPAGARLEGGFDADCTGLGEGDPGAFSGECIFDGYADEFNSGCNSVDSPSGAFFDELFCGDVICGTGGNHLGPAGEQFRDTDWYLFNAFATEDVTWRVTASFSTLIAIIELGPSPNECAFTIPAIGNGVACEPFEVTATVTAGSQYALFVATDVFEGVPANAPYVAEVICGAAETQACCFKDGTCQDLLPPDCLAEGGLPLGPDTACATADCCVVCDGSETEEGEPTFGCADDYIDNFNGGCNSVPEVFQAYPGGAVCGKSGTYVGDIDGDGVQDQLRDTDWYSYQHPGGVLSLSVTAQFSPLVAVIQPGPGGCADFTIPLISDAGVGRCTKVLLEGDLPAGEYYLFVAPEVFEGIPCGLNYNLEVLGDGGGCSPDCADATGDGFVDIADLNAVLANFNSAQNVGENGDVTCNGFVDIADLNLVLAQFNSACSN